MGFLVFLVIAIIVQTVIQVQAAGAQKKEAKKRAALEEKRIELDTARRNLQQKADEQRLQKEARKNAADILNRATGQGLTSAGNTAVRGAINASKQNLINQQDFSSQAAALGLRGDAITRAQVELAKNSAIRAADTAKASAIVGGIAGIAQAGLSVGGGGGGGNPGDSGIAQQGVGQGPFAGRSQ